MSRGDKVIAFIHEFCKVPDGRLVGKPIVLADFQTRFIREIYDNPETTHTALLSMARKNAKALALDTPIPTPTGWTTMGELAEGDYVLGKNGQPTRVILATEIMHGNTCYEVTFTDGEKIIADAGHQWQVRWQGPRRGDERRTGRCGTVTKTTQELIDGPYPRGSSGATHIWRVPMSDAVLGAEAELPVPPYCLGAWLGDGKTRGASAGFGVRDADHIMGRMRDEGWPVRALGLDRGCVSVALSDGVFNRSKAWCPLYDLREAGVLNNKRVPEVYQRASVDQRKALLRGLMDTDGSVSKLGQAVYGTTCEALMMDVCELIRGLGFKASVNEGRAMLNGVDYGPSWKIQFWPTQNDDVVSVPFKASRLKICMKGDRTAWKAIVSIKPVASVPVRCIQVDAADSLFLAGRNFTVTHNTATIACILLAHICGPEALQNTQIVSGAMSREQAALVFGLAVKIINLDPRLVAVTRVTPSSKTIIGVTMNVEYRALSAEATTAHGLSPVLVILDEVGQVVGPTSPFVEALTTAQGAHENPLLIAISTSSASDADMFSQWIDDAIRSGDKQIVAHEYKADANCDLMDETQWLKANPALGLFRSREDLRKQLAKASRLPALEASARNLLLNQRVSLISLWLAPSPWKACSGEPNLEAFQSGAYTVSAGLDLSARIDLTAVVLSVKDDAGLVSVLPFVFTPVRGLAEREGRDKAPYSMWVQKGFLITCPGSSVDYEWVAEYMAIKLAELGIRIDIINFDRWRIVQFKLAAAAKGFAVEAEWREVGQGYKDMSPRMTAFEQVILDGTLRHGGHPLLNMAASNAIAVKDPAGNMKVDKKKSSQRIDPLVAAIMAVFDVTENASDTGFDALSMIG